MRITGGEFRSRHLKTPRGDKTRPTADRVREALFSLLGARLDFEGIRVLDLYAGTGALGLEALSRGAAHATFIEKRHEALDALRENIKTLAVATRATVHAKKVEAAATALICESFDLVLADPPYADVQSGAAVAAVARLLDAGVLSKEGVFVLEHASVTPVPAFSRLGCVDSRAYGDTQVSVYGVLA